MGHGLKDGHRPLVRPHGGTGPCEGPISMTSGWPRAPISNSKDLSPVETNTVLTSRELLRLI